jgi:hypothetical protein
MTGRQRCDEILRLIDQALLESQPLGDQAAPRQPVVAAANSR